MISIIASMMLVIGCLYFILMPFTAKKTMAVDNATIFVEDKIKKEELYATLNEIEMDYKMNKLSEEDYKNMKTAYEYQVAEIIKKEGSKGKEKGISLETVDYIQKIEDEIEAELVALRNERRMKP
jgi:hypothetical protein